MKMFVKTVTAAFAMGAYSVGGATMAQSGSAQAAKNVVLVHGAFADDSSWSKVVPLLKSRGFNVTAVGNPLTSFADDVAATKRALARRTARRCSWGTRTAGL